jgi:hypothetical protein
MYVESSKNVVTYPFYNERIFAMKAWEYRNISIEQRFEQSKQIDPNTGCHNFLGFRTHQGYGKIKYKGKPYIAHRLFWIINKGEIPADKYVLHRCDNPSCFNLEHLFIGTNADNVADKVSKNRQYKPPKGKDHHRSMAKLTEQQVMEIKNLLKRGYSQADIHRDFEIKRQVVSDIALGKTWAWV